MKTFKRLRKIIRGSYWEGGLYAIMVGTTESFALYFALKSGISYTELGLLSTLPIVLGSLSQWLIPFLVKENTERFWKLLCYGIQVVGVALLIVATQSPHPQKWIFSALVLYWIGGMGSAPLWLNWVSSEVPTKIFSIFFSKRNAFVSLITVAAYLGTSVYLSRGEESSRFLIAFSFGCLARFLSLILQAWISLPSKPQANSNLSELQSRELNDFDQNDSSYKTVVAARVPIVEMFLFTVFFKAAASTSSPYFMPFMVQELKYSLVEYTALTSIPFVGRFLFLANWGRTVDGMKPFLGLTVAGFGIALVPGLWVAFPYYGFLMFLEMLSGIMWGGFELCALMILRLRYGSRSLKPIALHMALMNLGAMAGAQIGGHLLESGWTFKNLFYLSTFFRVSVTLAYLMRISSIPLTYQSVRAYGVFLTSVLAIRPSMGNVGRLLWIRKARRRWQLRRQKYGLLR